MKSFFASTDKENAQQAGYLFHYVLLKHCEMNVDAHLHY